MFEMILFFCLAAFAAIVSKMVGLNWQEFTVTMFALAVTIAICAAFLGCTAPAENVTIENWPQHGQVQVGGGEDVTD